MTVLMSIVVIAKVIHGASLIHHILVVTVKVKVLLHLRLFLRIQLLQILLQFQMSVKIDQSLPHHTDHFHLMQQQCIK